MYEQPDSVYDSVGHCVVLTNCTSAAKNCTSFIVPFALCFAMQLLFCAYCILCTPFRSRPIYKMYPVAFISFIYLHIQFSECLFFSCIWPITFNMDDSLDEMEYGQNGNDNDIGNIKYGNVMVRWLETFFSTIFVVVVISWASVPSARKWAGKSAVLFCRSLLCNVDLFCCPGVLDAVHGYMIFSVWIRNYHFASMNRYSHFIWLVGFRV